MPAMNFYYPFPSVGGDRTVTAAVERRFWAAMFTDGILTPGGFGLTINNTANPYVLVTAGIAFVGGAVGGLTTTANFQIPTGGATTRYLVARLDTTNAVRNMSIAVVDSLATATQAELENGAQRDLPLYKIGYNNGNWSITADMRTHSTSFDKTAFEGEFNALLENFKSGGGAAIEALLETFEQTIDAANTENAGLYGAQGRQGFINPCFEINQRGRANYGLTSGAAYTFDRWLARIGGAAASSAVLFDRTQQGSRLALRIQNKVYVSGTTAAASCIAQNIEGGVRRFCAGMKKFTVSFDAKASAAQKLAVEPVQFLESGGTGSTLAAQTVNLTTSWQRFTLTFTGSVADGYPTNSQFNDVLKVAFFFAWRNYSDRFGADNNAARTVYLANMQINEGESALPCYVREAGEELERAQRYYVKRGFTSLAVGATNAQTKQVVTSPLPLTRNLYRTPTVTVADRADTTGTASVQTAAGAWRNGLTVAMSDNATDNPVFIVTNSDTSEVARVCFNSVTIDAEIFD